MFPIQLPSLHERPEGIEPLARHISLLIGQQRISKPVRQLCLTTLQGYA